MKRNLLLSALIITTASIIADDQDQKPVDATEKYRTMKAHEVILHDEYDEVMPLEGELPQAYKDAIQKYGLDEKEIHFYTAISKPWRRINVFVQKVGKNIVILRPNFFIYLTQKEQASYIAIRLAEIADNYYPELEWPQDKKLNMLKNVSIGISGLALLALYRNQLLEHAQRAWPLVKDVIFSKAAAIIGGCAAINGIAYGMNERNRIQTYLKHELDSVDKIGAEGLISAREKQVGWGKRNVSWLNYQWNKLLAHLDLGMMPEVDLARIKAHLKTSKGLPCE